MAKHYGNISANVNETGHVTIKDTNTGQLISMTPEVARTMINYIDKKLDG